MPKIAYRIKNWSTYNNALINRGSLTVWVDEESINNWLNVNITGKKGRPCTYSNVAIETGLTLKTVWKIPLRMAQGLLESILQLMGIDLAAPNYTTLCRRASKLNVDLETTPSLEPRHLVIDSTGLKIFGEGEWHIRTHGKSKRRTWRKLHLSIDAKTHEIVACTLTDHKRHDSLETQNLLPKNEPIAAVYADKAYDNKNAYEPIVQAGARAVIPPRSGAALMQPTSWGIVERNRNVREKWFLGKELWKVGRKYHRRSLVETGMFRQKQILGDRLRSIVFENQVTEIRIRASILNRMTQLGMPQSYRIT
jgi:hypothetical protein